VPLDRCPVIPYIAAMSQKKKSDPNNKMIAENRRARHNYAVEDTLEVGVMLEGSEVKSMRRRRKLLASKREISKLWQGIGREGMTLVPLKLYFNDKGRVKLLLGVAKGKKAADKRETEKRRDWDRQKARLLRDRG